AGQSFEYFDLDKVKAADEIADPYNGDQMMSRQTLMQRQRERLAQADAANEKDAQAYRNQQDQIRKENDLACAEARQQYQNLRAEAMRCDGFMTPPDVNCNDPQVLNRWRTTLQRVRACSPYLS